jgi:tryptophanyl-tRNA synthetase
VSPRPRILSGMRPTGPLHLGHLTGALDNWVRLQDEYDCFYAVVDWHALTTDYADPSGIRQNIVEVATDWLAAGLDPARSTLFIQSLVPEHAELHLMLSMVTPLPWLERVPSYKEQQQQLQEKDLSTYGFLGYPLLQSADIIIYKADAVPVGEDQAPHIELTREVVRRFNNLYGPVFPEPKTLLTATPRVPGTDGRKMSKSYGNAVYLKDPPEETRQKIRPMVTDPARVRRHDPGNPDICPVFDLHKAFSTPETQAWSAHGCRTAGIGCLDCKGALLDHLLHRLEEIHERRPQFASRPDTVWDILREGSRRAREVARATMEDVREAMQVSYPGRGARRRTATPKDRRRRIDSGGAE